MSHRDRKGRIALTPEVLAAIRKREVFRHVIAKLNRAAKGGRGASFKFPGRLIPHSKMREWIKVMEEMSGHVVQR
jgi:hypothetical protein